MLIHAFAGEIVERVKCAPVREELDKIVWERLEASATAGSDAFVDPQACHAYVAAARTLLDARLEQEKQP